MEDFCFLVCWVDKKELMMVFAHESTTINILVYQINMVAVEKWIHQNRILESSYQI